MKRPWQRGDELPAWLVDRLPDSVPDDQHEVVARAHIHSVLEIPMNGDWREAAERMAEELESLPARDVPAWDRMREGRIAARAKKAGTRVPRTLDDLIGAS